VLIVMPDQWPRALIRSALREAGYDAVGTRDLNTALRIREAMPGRGPVRLIVVDQRALGGDDDTRLEQLRARHGGADVLLVASATKARPAGKWRRVLVRPVSVADVVSAVQSLLPLPAELRHGID
jgi:DNA-binding response OmpR family regulator